MQEIDTARAQVAYSTLLSTVIHGYRRRARLTQAELGDRIYVDRSRFCRLERGGGTATWNVDHLLLLSRELGVPPGQLVKRADAIAARMREFMPVFSTLELCSSRWTMCRNHVEILLRELTLQQGNEDREQLLDAESEVSLLGP